MSPPSWGSFNPHLLCRSSSGVCSNHGALATLGISLEESLFQALYSLFLPQGRTCSRRVFIPLGCTMDWEFPTHPLLSGATSCSALFLDSGILGRTKDWFVFKSGFVPRRVCALGYQIHGDPSLLSSLCAPGKCIRPVKTGIFLLIFHFHTGKAAFLLLIPRETLISTPQAVIQPIPGVGISDLPGLF